MLDWCFIYRERDIHDVGLVFYVQGTRHSRCWIGVLCTGNETFTMLDWCFIYRERDIHDVGLVFCIQGTRHSRCWIGVLYTGNETFTMLDWCFIYRERDIHDAGLVFTHICFVGFMVYAICIYLHIMVYNMFSISNDVCIL